MAPSGVLVYVIPNYLEPLDELFDGGSCAIGVGLVIVGVTWMVFEGLLERTLLLQVWMIGTPLEQSLVYPVKEKTHQERERGRRLLKTVPWLNLPHAVLDAVE